MNKLIGLIIIVFISYSFAFAQNENSTFYNNCIDELTKKIIKVNQDSILFSREYSEQWKSKEKIIGSMKRRDELIVFQQSDEIEKFFYLDSLEMFNFLIEKDSNNQWNQLKNEILATWEIDEMVMIFSEYQNINEKNTSRNTHLIKAKYDVIVKMICGNDILVQIPQSILKDYNIK